jgi:RNA polymerase sigma factor (sigma-70 family)
LSAWHAFIHEFGELIYRVIARHMPTEEVDEVRNVYVDVLESLYHGGLEKYEHRGSLHGWLAVYARRRAIDFVRSKYGRLRPPGGYGQLTPLEQDIFDIYIMERGTMETLMHMLALKGYHVSAADVAQALVRIESVIDRRYLRRLDYQRQARARGVPSAAAMEFIAKTRWEIEQRRDASRSDIEALSRKTSDRAAQLREAIAELPSGDKEMLSMKFERRLTAPEIARELRMGEPRRVYTALDRIIRQLRRRLGAGSDGDREL